jgi:ankyrin repeat protein
MIFEAIRRGDADQVRALLAADPSLTTSRTAEGATTLLWAVYTRHSELAPLLLGSRQPDFFEASALGDTARVAALLSADPGLVEAYSGDSFTGLGLAAFFGHAEVARLLLDAGADPSRASRNALGVTPLHSACAAGHAALVDLLLDRGADANLLEPTAMAPLHTAAGNGRSAIVARLLAGGADPGRPAQDGRTPAMVARDHGHPALAAQLGA